MNEQKSNFNLTWGSLWKLFFMLLLAVILFFAQNIILALFLAIVISAALDPVVSWLEKRRIPRILGTLSIYIVVIFFIGLVIYAIVPIALSELSTLLGNLDKVSGSVADFLKAEHFLEELSKNISRISNILLSGTSSLFDVTSKFLGGVAFTASIFVLSFYLTVGKDGVERFLGAVLPTDYESEVINLYDRIRKKIGRWLEGQVFLSFAVGGVVFLGLWLLGVKYSLLLGIVAGIFELVPYVGPIFSGSLAILIGLTDSLSLGVYTLILFIAVQQLENHILVPAVTKFTTALDPVVVLVSLMIGFQVFGLVGLILAVPAAVLLQEIIENWSASKRRTNRLGV